MTLKFTAIIILLSMLILIIPQSAFGLVGIPSDIGTGSESSEGGATISCTGAWWAKIACAVKKISDYLRSILNITNALSNIPHHFPFGGPILSSERACTFKFDEISWIPNPLCAIGLCFPPTIPIGPVPISIPLSGRAIEVGPPVPTNGKVIAFPWISRIYMNHTENRAGPWALGIGFSPFPLEDINDALEGITIWVPPLSSGIADPPCLLGGLGSGYLGACIENFRFDCVASGEKDSEGNDIYKVIRKLGTSKNNAPASAFPPGFTLP